MAPWWRLRSDRGAVGQLVLPFDCFELRRLVGAAFGVVGLFFTWRLGVGASRHPRRTDRFFCSWPLACLITGTCSSTPRMHPLRWRWPQGQFGNSAATGISTRDAGHCGDLRRRGGLAIGSRVMGGFLLLYALLPLLFVVAVKSRETGWKAALRECGTFVTSFIPAAILAYFVMALVWPWA